MEAERITWDNVFKVEADKASQTMLSDTNITLSPIPMQSEYGINNAVNTFEIHTTIWIFNSFQRSNRPELLGNNNAHEQVCTESILIVENERHFCQLVSTN